MASEPTVQPAGGAYPPIDPPPPGPLYAMSYLPVRGASLALMIVGILLCLQGLTEGFITFMILALAFEVLDVLTGVRHLRQVWSGVENCISIWRRGPQPRAGGS